MEEWVCGRRDGGCQERWEYGRSNGGVMEGMEVWQEG